MPEIHPAPGVDVFTGWVIAGLCVTVVTLAGILFKLALAGLAREIRLAELALKTAEAAEAAAKATAEAAEIARNAARFHTP